MHKRGGRFRHLGVTFGRNPARFVGSGSRWAAGSEIGGVSLLTVHLYVGIAVVALALLAVWWRTGRRITLYVVTLQILLGIVLMVQGLRVPPFHYGLAVAGWAGYMVANGMGRRGVDRRAVLLVSALSTVLLLVAFAIGQGVVRAGSARSL